VYGVRERRAVATVTTRITEQLDGRPALASPLLLQRSQLARIVFAV
jgi:hypothetical protein